MEVTSAYDVLGVRPDATLTEVRRAYRSRVRTLHPDAGGAADPVRLRAVQDAYRALAKVAPPVEPTRQPTPLPRERRGRYIDVFV